MKCIVYYGYVVGGNKPSLQTNKLVEVAQRKGWEVKKVVRKSLKDFIFAMDNNQPFVQHELLFENLEDSEIKMVVIDKIDFLGRRITDIQYFIKELHKRNVSLYIYQLDMVSLENDKENTTFNLLLHMMASAVEIEEIARRQIRRKGIAKAKREGKYKGRRLGAIASDQKLLAKYKNIIELIKQGNLSLRKIATQTNHAVNTVQKIKRIIARS